MAALASHLRLRDLGYSLLLAGFLTAACGGKSADADDGKGPSTSGTSGATGGTSGTSGTSGATGGTAATGTGGSQGGTTDHDNGGDTSSAGTGDLGGKGGSDIGGTGGTSDAQCKDVICEAIPKTCTKIVQEPGACCPTCPDTGCEPCISIGCGDGTHPETAPGECCPTCVADPPNACEQGRAAYADMRAALIDKYGSGSCKNSSECGLVQEDNACGSECPVALPSTTLESFVANLENAALGCSSCASARLPPSLCMPLIAACVNGRCTAQPQ